MRDLAREDLFERWLETVRDTGPYDDPHETFREFTERITVSDTVHGGAEVSPAPERRDELSDEGEGSTNPGNADPCIQVRQSSDKSEPTHGELF